MSQESINHQNWMKRNTSTERRQPPTYAKIFVKQIEIVEEENFAATIVVVIWVVGEMMDKDISMIKVTWGMSFSVTIAKDMGM